VEEGQTVPERKMCPVPAIWGYGLPMEETSWLPGKKKPDLALKHGTEVTDIITSRVEIKYAYSPFKSPPVTSFRANWNLAVS
jgi:hypothetical protein